MISGKVIFSQKIILSSTNSCFQLPSTLPYGSSFQGKPLHGRCTVSTFTSDVETGLISSGNKTK